MKNLFIILAVLATLLAGLLALPKAASASTSGCTGSNANCGVPVNAFGNAFDVKGQKAVANNPVISYPNSASDPATDFIRTSPQASTYRYEYAPNGAISGLCVSDPGNHQVMLRSCNTGNWQLWQTGNAGNGGNQLVNVATKLPVTTNGTKAQLTTGGSYTGGSYWSWQGGSTATVWQPPQNAEWQWMISHPLDTSNTSDMGTGKTAWNGNKPPATDPSIYDIDAIINPASTVSALHAKGFHVIGYIEVGTAGDYYSADDEGISTTYYDQFKNAGVTGGSLPGYPEVFLNINDPKTLPIVEAMIKEQIKDKGFDAVETDLDTTFNGNDGKTPWTITESTEVAYMTAIANYCHSIGIAWIAKNLDESGDMSFVSALQPLAQGMISEQNREDGTYPLLAPFTNNHKWVGDAEYNIPLSQFAPQDNAANVNGVLFNQDLSGSRQPAR